MYTLKHETEKRRVYVSEITGTEVATTLLKTGEDGQKWWGFEDLMNIPYIRKNATAHIEQMYVAGITPEDLKSHFANMKKLLKSADPDKYEKCFAEVLRVEQITESATDPVRQTLALATVYVLKDDERIDTYNLQAASDKIETWTLQPDLQAFFLNWLTDGMNAYSTLYAEVSRIASMEAPEQA